jgi:hypothetical protein
MPAAAVYVGTVWAGIRFFAREAPRVAEEL